MLKTYTYPKFAYVQPEERKNRTAARYPVVIIGAGPVGLAAAIDWPPARHSGGAARRDDTVSIGSRGVCYAKRALEILDRLGVGERYSTRAFRGTSAAPSSARRRYSTSTCCRSPTTKRPGMINLQQYYLEQYLVERCVELGVDMRWKNRVVSVQRMSDQVRLTIETPDGTYGIEADWLIVGDGAAARSANHDGAGGRGQDLQDRFLIADVVMKADFPAERWFWFDPPFHPNQSCCCTSRPTTSGASTSSSAGRPIPGRRRSRRR